MSKKRHAARRLTRLRVAGIICASTFLAAASIVGYNPSTANATSYPSWSDVVKARHNAAASKAAVKNITALIASLKTQVQDAQADAAAKSTAAEAADNSYYMAADTQKTLQAQVDTAAAQAAKSEKQLSQYVAQLARTGGQNGGTTLQLALNGKGAGQLLNNLGTISQASQREEDTFKKALADKNSVNQLNKLAKAQAVILNEKKKEAEAASAAPAAAAAKLETALSTQTAHLQPLTLELAALTTKLKLTETQYNAGVRAAAAARARAAAAGGGSGVAGVVSSAGWALPTIGVISSPYGYRNDPAAGGMWRMHYGDDIAHGCLQPIYAAHAGTVSYVGPYGDIGNYIMISNGDQYTTAYGHIANGQTFVHIGQHVSAGQNIARTGSTGFSTGCHLYFQIFSNGLPLDPVPFMRARGIVIGRL